MRQTLIGLLTAGLAALALAGSLLLTFAEGGFPGATQVAGIGATATLFLNPPSTPPASPPAPQATPEIPPPAADSSPTPAQAAPAATEAIPPATVAPPPTAAAAAPVILPTVCGPQAGWVAIVVQRGDTLYKIALRSGVTPAALQQANCLGTTTALFAGEQLYVPPGAPAVLTTSVAGPSCGAPPDWVTYTVQRGDNLFRLSLHYSVSQSLLQAANCLGSAARIYAGQILRVPPMTGPPPATASPTQAPEAAQPLVIQYVEAQSIRRDSAVPGGAIVTVRVDFSGGAAPFSFYDEGLPQPENPYDLASTCGGTLVHTARVESGDGQGATLAYLVSVDCPP